MSGRAGDDDRDEVSSPACLMHETDPAYAGFADDGELIAFLSELLETVRTEPWPLRLRHHITALGGDQLPKVDAPLGRETSDFGTDERVRRRLRDMLPRVRDDELHAELGKLLRALERTDE